MLSVDINSTSNESVQKQGERGIRHFVLYTWPLGKGKKAEGSKQWAGTSGQWAVGSKNKTGLVSIEPRIHVK